MKLHAKIKKEYMNEILEGSKNIEYRQFESITLTDEKGRTATFDVTDVSPCSPFQDQDVRRVFDKVNWDEHKHIFRIFLGERI